MAFHRSAVPTQQPEPWLRGPIEDVHPSVMPVFFSFAQVREDLAQYSAGLTNEQTWEQVGGSSLGFHLRHMAGSIDRLTTYLKGGQLSAEQLNALQSEAASGTSLARLLEQLWGSIAESEQSLRQLDPQRLYERRSVGRKALPTTAIGLIVHLSEHTQRHLGQAITICKILRQVRADV